jgi:NAD(P)-dependent dehydrogenase (short-subunit alcohol dehydrogenase family)
MKNISGKTAAVTGAGSGIGRMLAVHLAREGCGLALADISAKGLEETAGLVGSGVKVTTHVVDVSDRERVFAYADEAVKAHGGVDLVINNAGVALGDFLDTVPLEDFEWLMGVNFWGVVYGTMAFLPHLKKRPEGHVVNISSINGILPNPNNGPYCAAKFAVKGYTETLAQEMHGTNIRVSCVHPGGIKTNIARSAKINRTLYSLPKDKGVSLYEEKLFKTTADEAARIIVDGIKRDRRRIMVGADARVMDIITRFFPVRAVDLAGWVSRTVVRKWMES